MSIRRLPREMGIWIVCDGTDHEDCTEKRFTANVYAKVNREYAAKGGWGRGLRTDRKRRDQCPKHLEIERKLFEEQKANREAEKKRRDELKKAKLSATPLPKKPRKKKGASPEVHASPSAASAPAPAT